MTSSAVFAILMALQMPQPEPDEIVVTARKRQCQVSIANRVLTTPEFKARAEEWAAGKPVRVIVPSNSRYKCLAQIVFRLNDQGVRLIHWVYPSEVR